MAIDEMLLLSQDAGHSGVLRFYTWEEPALTAGYFQDIRRVAEIFDAMNKELPVVRRLTGGGAVLHGQDLTFSLCLPTRNAFFPTDVKSSYLKINEAVRAGLKRDYPAIDYADCRTVPTGRKRGANAVCFDSPACYDLLLNGRKILGSSQRRMGGNLLHQASLFLNSDPTGLTQKITDGFKQDWKVSFEETALDPQELRHAQEIERSRYSSLDWALLRERSFFS